MKFDSVIIRDAFAEIGRPPPEPKGMVDTLPLLTQWFGPRAGDMKVYNNLISYILMIADTWIITNCSEFEYIVRFG